MKLIRETSPYIRRKANVARMMIDVLIALLPIVIFTFIKNFHKILLLKRNESVYIQYITVFPKVKVALATQPKACIIKGRNGGFLSDQRRF